MNTHLLFFPKKGEWHHSITELRHVMVCKEINSLIVGLSDNCVTTLEKDGQKLVKNRMVCMVQIRPYFVSRPNGE